MGSNSIAKFWNKAKENGGAAAFGDAVPLEPGKYTMQLVDRKIDDFGDQRKIMLTWAVLDEEKRGTLCKMWEGLDEERLVWLQRLLVSMGLDLNDLTIEDEDDLDKVFGDLIADNCVASVKVTEKDGWTNMRVQKRVEVETDELLDPEEAVKSGGGGGGGGSKSSSKGSSKSEAKEEPKDEGFKIDEGDVVQFMHPKTKKKAVGEIVGFDDDDNPKIMVEGEKKAVVVPIDSVLEKVEADKPEAAAEPEVDDVVVVKVDGKDKRGVVSKVKDGHAWVKVKGKDEPVKVKLADISTEVE